MTDPIVVQHEGHAWVHLVAYRRIEAALATEKAARAAAEAERKRCADGWDDCDRRRKDAERRENAERTAHERARAELEDCRAQLQDANCDEAQTIARLTAERHELANAIADHWRPRALAAESALTSARKLLAYAAKWVPETVTWHDDYRTLSTTPTPAPVASGATSEAEHIAHEYAAGRDPSTHYVQTNAERYPEVFGPSAPVASSEPFTEYCDAVYAGPSEAVSLDKFFGAIPDMPLEAPCGGQVPAPSEPVAVTEARALFDELVNHAGGISVWPIANRIRAWLSAHPKPEAEKGTGLERCASCGEMKPDVEEYTGCPGRICKPCHREWCEGQREGPQL